MYAAELACGIEGETFPRLGECQRYVNSILAGTSWRLRYPHVHTVEVRDGGASPCGSGRGRGAALMGSAHAGTIWLPRPTRFQRYIIHELAHLVQPRGTQAHGPEFCRIYLNGVHRILGPTAGEALATSFLAYGAKTQERATNLLTRLPASLAGLLVTGL